MSWKKLFSQLPKEITDIIVDYHCNIQYEKDVKKNRKKLNKSLRQIKKMKNIIYKGKQPYEMTRSFYNLTNTPSYSGIVISDEKVIIICERCSC